MFGRRRGAGAGAGGTAVVVGAGGAAGPSAALPEAGAGADAARADAFISYSHTDTEFVEGPLLGALEAQGKKVWLDLTDIPAASDWPERIRAGIEAARTFVFVISPASVASGECRKELDEATKLNKPLVPIRRIDVAGLPAALEGVQWIPLGESDPFEAGMAALIVALDDDLEWRDLHNEYSIRASDWVRESRDPSLLLRGRALAEAERWQEDLRPHRESPTAEQSAFILAGRRAATRRQWLIVGAVGVALAVALALAAVALIQRNRAIDREQAATSRALAAEAVGSFPSRTDLGALLAIEAMEERFTPEARSAAITLVQGMDGLEGILPSDRPEPVQRVDWSSDGRRVVSAAADSVVVWDRSTRPWGRPPTRRV